MGIAVIACPRTGLFVLRWQPTSVQLMSKPLWSEPQRHHLIGCDCVCDRGQCVHENGRAYAPVATNQRAAIMNGRFGFFDCNRFNVISTFLFLFFLFLKAKNNKKWFINT